MEARKLPSLAKEGWTRHQERCCEASLLERTGAKRRRDSAQHKKRSVQQPIMWRLDQTTPSAPSKEASRHLITGAATPPWLRREFQHSTRILDSYGSEG
jgi:hypothetical protein